MRIPKIATSAYDAAEPELREMLDNLAAVLQTTTNWKIRKKTFLDIIEDLELLFEIGPEVLAEQLIEGADDDPFADDDPDATPDDNRPAPAGAAPRSATLSPANGRSLSDPPGHRPSHDIERESVPADPREPPFDDAFQKPPEAGEDDADDVDDDVDDNVDDDDDLDDVDVDPVADEAMGFPEVLPLYVGALLERLDEREIRCVEQAAVYILSIHREHQEAAHGWLEADFRNAKAFKKLLRADRRYADVLEMMEDYFAESGRGRGLLPPGGDA